MTFPSLLPGPVGAAVLGASALTLTATVLGTTPPPASRPEPAAPHASLAAAHVAPDPAPDPVQEAARLVAGMTLAQKAGQVIVAGYRGTGAPVALVRDLHLGGTVPVGHNVSSPAQITRVNRAIGQVVAARGYPAFIGVDQEGGTVNRLGAPATAFGTFMGAGAARRPDLTRAAYQALGQEMAAAGFTVVLAPVADVTAGATDPVIGSRSAGSRPHQVATQVIAAQAGLADAGVVGVLKHFPGHGSVNADSHLTLPVQRKSRARLMATDLVPFRSAFAAGSPAVMIGHLNVRAIDPGVPASVSRKVISGLLRRDLGYRGLVVTDGLGMLGVARTYPSKAVGWRTLWAGSDVVLMPDKPRVARNGIINAVRRGWLPMARLDEAATRMIATLLAQSPRAAVLGSGAPAAGALASAALTSVSGPCRGPIAAAVRVSGPRRAAVAFRRAARAEGLRLGTGPKVVLTVREPARAGIVVALDRPGVLGRSQARVRLASYGATPAAMRAVVRFLLGRAPAPGRLPVGVRGVPRAGC